MKYSKRLTIGIAMKEFYFFAKPTITDKKRLHKIIKNELYHCWHGIVDGNHCDWKLVFYKKLFEDGFIQQTEECKKWYGDFTNI